MWAGHGRGTGPRIASLLGFAALFGSMAAASGPVEGRCTPAGEPVSIDQVVDQVAARGVRYVFVGERHESGPPKRLAVDLANALVDRGHDVGLYVEGFRAGCPVEDSTCHRLAELFNVTAFAALAGDSLAPVRPLDPEQRDDRAARMAATISAGREAIRIVLVGRSHVVHASDPEAELWVYGGGMRYADPGDLVEAFPRDESLTLVLETSEAVTSAYSLLVDGCLADYRFVAPATGAY